MAWVIGAASEAEMQKLMKEGFKVQKLDLKTAAEILNPPDAEPGEITEAMIAVYVDVDAVQLLTPKKEKGRLTFGDLEVGALFRLLNREEVRIKVNTFVTGGTARHNCVFVDDDRMPRLGYLCESTLVCLQ